MRERRIVIVLMILTIVFTLFGSTLAYWNWTSEVGERTNIVFTMTQDFSCSVDGGGNITETDAFIVPTSCTDSNHAIKKEVKVTPTLLRDHFEVSLDLWINVNSIGSGLSNSQNFKYALTTSDSSCTEGVKLSGSFNGATVGSKFNILNDVIYTESTTDTYYLYIWLDSAETSTSTMDQKFNLSLGGECNGEEILPYEEEILNETGPILSSGMIPVTISNTGAVTTADLYSDWYSYEDKEWANAVLVNNTSRSSYYEADGVTIKPNQTIPEDNILAYFVWIPKYSYKINGTEQPISIAFNDTPTGYIEHPSFNFGQSIRGFWVGKFETSHATLSLSESDNLACFNVNCVNADDLRIKPNVISKRADKVSYQFYASRSMERSGNPFGFVSSNVDTHMIKNTEWGAVSYLSLSQYGINGNIRLNNNSAYTTGCGATAENGASSNDCEITYGAVSLGEYPQSTTGNITGVFDMSGGAYEYVMGYYSGASTNFGYISETNYAGFSSSIESKYWDEYTTTNVSTACNGGICYGQGLSETLKWFGDYNYFVLSDYPWLSRGGNFEYGAGSGLFNTGRYYGDADVGNTFRVVAVNLA